MRQDPDEPNQHIEAARLAISKREFQAARGHLFAAEGEGVPNKDVRSYFEEIDALEKETTARSKSFGIGATCVLCFGYLLLSMQSPAAWSVPVWAVASFIVVPATAGALMGKALWVKATQKARFGVGLFFGGGAMALYTGINLLLARSRISTPSDSDMFGILVTVSIAYGIVAGCVAGLSSAGFGLGRAK